MKDTVPRGRPAVWGRGGEGEGRNKVQTWGKEANLGRGTGLRRQTDRHRETEREKRERENE